MEENNMDQIEEPLLPVDPPDVEENAQADNNEQPISVVAATKRVYSMDLTRGMLVMIMAWDHCKDILRVKQPSKHHGGEMWSGEMNTYNGDGWQFFARSVSHICAPGFFFTMGAAMILFTLSRTSSVHGWTLAEVQRHYLLRGFMLLILGRIVNVEFAFLTLVDYYEGRNVTAGPNGNTIHFPNDMHVVWDGALVGSFQVLTCLGLTMICAALLFLRPAISFYKYQSRGGKGLLSVQVVALVTFLTIFFISNTVVVTYQGEDLELDHPWPRISVPADGIIQQLVRMVILPGSGWGFFGNFSYPLIPWIGVTALGMGFGFMMKADKVRAHAQALVGGVSFLLLFVIIRLFGGKWLGNLRGYPRGEYRDEVGFIQSFFSVCKYPPSLAYALLTIGLVSVAMWGFSRSYFSHAVDDLRRVERLKQASTNSSDGPGTQHGLTHWYHYFAAPFLVFGQSPLFFYMAHFVVYSLWGVVLHSLPHPVMGLTLPQLFPVWLSGLVILYPLCKRYFRFKSTTDPHSLWRLL